MQDFVAYTCNLFSRYCELYSEMRKITILKNAFLTLSLCKLSTLV
jgi:hypothetical protein